MIPQNPIITVLMPMYNSEKYISEAVESILNQTYADFEFIIIDDASSDNSVSIVESFKDPRIKLIIKPINTGLTSSLNMGLTMAKGKYIARMDSDDISVLDRFEKQLAFMEVNTHIALCGTWFKFIDNNEYIKHPAEHEDIQVALLSYCAIGHPTVFMRNSFLKQHQLNYNVEMEPAEDYDLWARICFLGNLANIPEVLLYYRLHNEQVSSLQNDKQIVFSNQIKIKLLNSLLPGLNLDLFSLNNEEETEIVFIDMLTKRLEILDNLQLINNSKQIFKTSSFNLFIIDLKKRLSLTYFADQRSKDYKNLLLVIANLNKVYKLVEPNLLAKYGLKVLIGYKSKNYHVY